jgi:hypothetical protein
MLLVASVIVCSIMIYWIVEGGWRTWKSLRLLLGSPSRLPVDVSQNRPEFPDVLKPEVTELKSLGFRRLGETEIKPPQFRDPLTTWVFIENTRAIAAELTWGRSRWHLNSYFDDGAWLVTDFPRGESNQAPGFKASTIHDTLTHAVEVHRQGIEAFAAEHGAALALQRFSDYLDRLRAAHEAHGLTRVGRVLRLQIARTAAVVYSAGALAVTAFSQTWTGLSADQAVPILVRAGIWLAPAFLVMVVTDWLASRRG